MKHHKKPSLFVIISVLTAAVLLSSCTPSSIQEEIKGDDESIPEVLTVKVVAETDPSLLDMVLENPYMELLDMAKDSLFPDEKLYNDLYHAIREGEEKLDVSGYDLSLDIKQATLDSMYSTVGIELFHVDRMRLSADGNVISISYVHDVELFRQLNRIYYARLSHIIYNVPEGPTQIEKYFSVYDHVSRMSSYSIDIDDQLTHTAASIILHGQGICGGYSMLNYHILKKLGIRSLYLMNDPHAWNMVTLEGMDYVTDLTWGAGDAWTADNLRHILTSTKERNRTLDEYGYGGSSVYTGFYRDEMVLAHEPQNNVFAHLYDLYTSYALDTKNGHLYYSDADGIKRSDLDGSNRNTISEAPGEQLIYFDDALYYISFSDCFLYRFTENHGVERAFDDYRLEKLTLEKGVLHFKEIGEEGKSGMLDLNRYTHTEDEAVVLNEMTLRREDTLRFVLDFSSAMDKDGSFQEYIGLLDENDQIIPFHYLWSEDGKTLSLRSAEALTDIRTLRLRIGRGLKSVNESLLEESYDMVIEILD